MKKIPLIILILLLCLGNAFAFSKGVQAVVNTSQAGTSKTLDDSYSESNVSDYASCNSTYTGYSQSFTSGGGTLDSVKFYMYKNAEASGNMYAKVYSHTGTYGTTSKPSSLLATSDVKNASTLGEGVGAVALVEFTFSGAERVTLTNGTYYVVTIEYAGATAIKIGQDQTSPTHGGNEAYQETGAWTEESYDNAFYLYVYR